VAAAVDLAAEDPRARELRREHADFTSYLGIATQAPAEAGALIVEDLFIVWICHGPQIGLRLLQIQSGSGAKLFKLIDHALNDRKALAPEGGIRGIEAEGGQQFLVALAAPG